jgi:hypothetical protein
MPTTASGEPEASPPVSAEAVLSSFPCRVRRPFHCISRCLPDPHRYVVCESDEMTMHLSAERGILEKSHEQTCCSRMFPLDAIFRSA